MMMMDVMIMINGVCYDDDDGGDVDMETHI